MNDLTQGKVGRQIFYFALPMLIGNVFQQLYQVVDSIVVGNYLGKEALSAVGASFPLLFVLLSLVIGFATGATIIISQFFGAKKIDKVKNAVDTLYIVMFFASIVITIIGLLFSKKIFLLIDLPDEILPQAKSYFNIIIIGSIFMFGFNGTSAILRGMGDSKTPLYFLIISTIINIILVLIFVTVFKWGIKGAAWATNISVAISFFISVIYLNKYHEIIKISLFKLKFNKEIFINSLKIGLPSGLQHMFVALGMMALLSIVNKFGTDVIAAYTVAGRIDSFALMPAMNFSMALTAFVGQNIGAGLHDRVKKGLKSTWIMMSGISIFFSVVALIFSKQLMSIFTPEQSVIEIGSHYLIIVSTFYIAFSTMFAFNAVFRGAGDTIIPMFITLFSLWLIRIPISYVLSMDIDFYSITNWVSTPSHITGIWWGIPLAWVFGMIFTIIYYFSGRWKKKVIIKQE
jgi:putative MATE family efflux protein